MKVKKVFFRPFCALLALCLCLPLFGCENSRNAENSQPVGSKAIPEEPLTLISGGNVQIAVVRPDILNTTDPDVLTAVAVRKYLDSLATGEKTPIFTDWDHAKDEAAVEILVGKVNHDASREVYATLGYGDYAVRQIGHKIVVAGYSEQALKAALNAFTNLIDQYKPTEGQEISQLTVPAEILNLRGEADAVLNRIPVFSQKGFDSCGSYGTQNPTVTVTFSNVTSDLFLSYTGMMTEKGYQCLLAANGAAIPNYTFQKDGYRVEMNLQKNEKIMSVRIRKTGNGTETVYGLCVKDTCEAKTAPAADAANAGVSAVKYDTFELLSTESEGWYETEIDGKKLFFAADDVRAFGNLSELKAYAAVVWARDIAADDEFHYGHNDWAHHHGCYFCGTNGPNSVKVRNGANYEDQLKTYCCNPFVTAAYCHGAGAIRMGADVTQCVSCTGNKINLANDNNPALTNTRYFAYIEKPKSIRDLLPGDVLLTPTHAFIVSENDMIVEASGGDDNVKNSDTWNYSIRERTISSSLWNSVTKIYRYIGE